MMRVKQFENGGTNVENVAQTSRTSCHVISIYVLHASALSDTSRSIRTDKDLVVLLRIQR